MVGEIIQKKQNYCRRHSFGEKTEEGSDAAGPFENNQNKQNHDVWGS